MSNCYEVIRILSLHHAGTFDVRNISLNQSQPITEGRVCLNVDFVDGYETPAEIFILFKSNKSNFFKRLNETSTMCVQNVPPNSTYDIFAIDGDAKDQIDTAAAVNITGVFVPYYVPPTTPSSTIVTGKSNIVSNGTSIQIPPWA